MRGRRRRGDPINYERQQWHAPKQILPLPPSEIDILVGRVAAYAAAFEGRWRVAALDRIDSQLAERFREQVALWEAALKGTDEGEIINQGRAMMRGWVAVTRRMEDAAAADADCLVGYDKESDTHYVISDHPADLAATRARLDEGASIALVTPDQVAALVAKLGPLALAVLREWPGAEIVAIRDKGDQS